MYLYAVWLLKPVCFVPHTRSQNDGKGRFAAERVYSQGSQERQGAQGIYVTKNKAAVGSEAWGVCGKVIGRRYDNFHSAQA